MTSPYVQIAPQGLRDDMMCVWMFVCACIHLCSFLLISPSHEFTHGDTVWVSVPTWVSYEHVFPSVCSICSVTSSSQVPQRCCKLSVCVFSSVHEFLLQFTEVGMFETVWQVKYYNYNKRDHCQWGNSFNSIEYECKPNDTRTLMWVNKEMFVWWRSSLKWLVCAKTQNVTFVIISMSWWS